MTEHYFPCGHKMVLGHTCPVCVNADLVAALKWIDTYLANQPLDQQAKFLIIEKVKDALAKAKGQLGT